MARADGSFEAVVPLYSRFASRARLWFVCARKLASHWHASLLRGSTAAAHSISTSCSSAARHVSGCLADPGDDAERKSSISKTWPTHAWPRRWTLRLSATSHWNSSNRLKPRGPLGSTELRPAHVPAAPAHWPVQHPVDDAPTLEPASRHRRRPAHGDYLLVLSSTRTSCQPRHRRARVAPVTATRRTIGHR